MDVHSPPAAAKRMWSYLRAVFFMMRKGVVSKRKLLVGMHLVMKRGNKAVARSVANLLSHHHGNGQGHGHHALRRREYEFSCSDGRPDPASSFSRRGLAYFPCLGADDQVQDPAPLHASPEPGLYRIEYYAGAAASPGLLMQELAPGEEEEEEEECTLTPARSPLMPSPGGGFSVRVSDFSSEEEGGVGSEAVDDEAEEFISRFYEQLRRQNQVALLPYLQESTV